MNKGILFSLMLFFCLNAVAQDRSEIELYKARFNSEKTQLVKEFMDLTSQEGELFWPIFNAFESERSVISDKRIELLYQYANFYETFTNEQAADWYNEVLELQQREIALKKKYNKRMAKAFSPLIALRYFQFEEFIQAEIRSAIIENLPFLENY